MLVAGRQCFRLGYRDYVIKQTPSSTAVVADNSCLTFTNNPIESEERLTRVNWTIYGIECIDKFGLLLSVGSSSYLTYIISVD